MAAHLLTLLVLLPLFYLFLPFLARRCGVAAGWYIRRQTHARRDLLLARVAAEEKEHASRQKLSCSSSDEEWEKVESNTAKSAVNGEQEGQDWKGFVGFFHPFCNAGGGGERVLWAAIRATQQRWPSAICVVYTGDHNVDKTAMLRRVEDRFNIHLHPPTVVFLYLMTRNYVLASKYPHFTLLGQSLGSLVLAYDALSLLVPDIFIDTMGYAFALALVKLLFPDVPTAAYVHYPTISTDMLGSLDDDAQAGRGVNAGLGRGWKGKLKRHYWHFFARLYSWVGGEVDVVMTNSSWTQNHIRQLWGASRRRRRRADNDITVVFPPVAVEELEREIDVGEESEKSRHPHLLYIAQFRPEKNHQLVLTAFARFLHSQQHPSTSSSTPSTTTTTTTTPGPADPPKLILIGSVRDSDDATRVYKLRLLAHELKIKESVTFVCDASWSQILAHLRTASVGVNSMWNEHFGIGVVEYQAAGLLAVVHDSGGPRGDIVVDVDGDGNVNDDLAGGADAGADDDGGGGRRRRGGGGGGGGTGPTGFRATDAASFALAFSQALALPPQDRLAMRRRARVSAKRFGEDVFARRWVGQMERLVELRRPWETGRGTGVNVGVGGGGGPDGDGGGGQITGRHD